MQKMEVYKCEVCGKVMTILNPGAENTVCCGQNMTLMEPKTDDWKGEKHVPHIAIDGNKVIVDIGIEMGTPHPMTDEHWIMWIELVMKDGTILRKFLNPGDEPKAMFVVASTDGIWSREYCNLHGLWKSA
jgi:superoxide reductase